MAVQWTVEFTATSDIIEEPYTIADSISYEFTFTNTSPDNMRATNVGFYIKQASTEGERGFPSSEGVVVDWYDILLWGESAPILGLFILQGGSPTQFTLSAGAGPGTAIPLSVGTGTDSNEVDPAASVNITFNIVAPVGPARRLFFDVELFYNEQQV